MYRKVRNSKTYFFENEKLCYGVITALTEWPMGHKLQEAVTTAEISWRVKRARIHVTNASALITFIRYDIYYHVHKNLPLKSFRAS
jgi:hypothetical protein